MSDGDAGTLTARLGRLAGLQFGDLVLTYEGQYGLVLDHPPDPRRESVLLAVGRGTTEDVPWHELQRVLLPGSPAPANFAEWLRPGGLDSLRSLADAWAPRHPGPGRDTPRMGDRRPETRG